MGIITVTELESAHRCGWMHDFNSLHRMSLESANPLRSLYLGTLWHKALDMLAQKEQISKLAPHQFDLDPASKNKTCKICHFAVQAHMKDPFMVLAGELTLKVKEHYESSTGRQISQLEMKPTFDTISMCKTMLDNYIAHYQGRLIPEGYEYIQTEQQFFKQLPDTEHCTCYLKPKCICQMINLKTGKRTSCMYKYGYYTHCKCEDGQCGLCRDSHKLEGTLDGLIKHTQLGHVAILENKTFSIHPEMSELHRTSQFMGYTWIGLDFNTDHLLYNGAWSKDHVPDGYNRAAGRKWSKQDLFIRQEVRWQPAEIDRWAAQAAITAMQIFDPRYAPIRVVHPVGGCNGVNGCSYKTLCDARFTGREYERILKNEYRQRVPS